MQQKAIITEPATMSWARAVILATGFFFLAVIYLGQIPAYFELASTQATLGRFEQTFLELGLLTGGLALIGITASFLFDPKPITKLFIPAFGLLGAVLAVAGAGLMLFVVTSGHEFFPDQTITSTGSGKNLVTTVTNWPDPSHGWFLNPIWFQPQSVDIGAVGFVLLFTGAGILAYVALFLVRDRLTPSLRNGLLWLSAGGASALVLAYLTMFTFSPVATTKTPGNGAAENIILGLALGLVLFALQLWLLPVMTAPGNRQRFMPANYLHAVQLLASIAVPLLVMFVILYPLVYWLEVPSGIVPSQNYFVHCAVKTNIPGSCNFTANIGYIIAAIVSSQFFVFILAAGYLWNRKPAFVRLGTVYAFVFASLAVVATHTVDPNYTPIALVIATGVAILGLIWTVATQREFVPAQQDARALGCTGQWLVVGTLLFIYLAGFAFLSYPQFLETEQNLIIFQGAHTVHDAYWVMLLAGALAAIHFGFLTRRQPIGMVRKATLWIVLLGAGLQVAGAITINLQSGSLGNITYFSGVIVEVLGILIGLWGAIQIFNRGGLGFLILTLVTAFIGGALAIFFYTLGFDELTVAFTMFMGTGAILYTIFGSDGSDRLLARLTRQTTPAPATPQSETAGG